MIEDAELLRRYAAEDAQEAFAELVQRHINLVYSAALRQTNGDTQLAADATQLVFTDLARKAGRLAGHQVLAGWLYTSTRYAACNLVRSERRRRAREQEALHMETQDQEGATPELDWARVRPVLDEAMAELNRVDREAVLLRFFEGRDYAGVGEKLAVPANTARMRVERALDKLRARLARRGLTSTSAALAAALAGEAVTAAPGGLAGTVAGAALAGAAASTGGWGAIFLTMTKTQMAVGGALVAAGVGGFWVQAGDLADARAEIAALERQDQVVAQLRADNDRLARRAAEATDLRLDDALLAQLSEDAFALQTEWRKLAAAERAKVAAARAPLTGPILEVSQLDRPPAVLAQGRPAYPVEMRRAGVSGQATISFVVDREGLVREAKPVKSSHKEFEAAAIEALEKWKFRPPLKDGRPVNARVVVPIVFTMSNGETKGPPPAWWF